MSDARPVSNPMIDHVGVAEAVSRVLAMAEGKRRGRHDEAKRRERRKYDREPEAKPSGESGQHGLEMPSLLLLPA